MTDNLVKNQFNVRPKVIFSPLDWGLGHTTRSIPILEELEKLDFEIIIACNSIQSEILRASFPKSRFVPLEGYGIRFGKSRFQTLAKIGFQAPKILTKIKSENQWIKHFCLAEKPSLLVSDSRFGFRSSSCPSVIITHQLQIKTGLGSVTDRLINSLHCRYLQQFDECWVPDSEETNRSLAGELSVPATGYRGKLKYLGPLSRFETTAAVTSEEGPVLFLLSGPEPQRSLLESSLLSQAALLPDSFILVRGLPGETALPNAPINVQCYNHLPPTALLPLLQQCSRVISRSGYTSLMDYAALGCKALLIPTPGQAEQEYLAQYWEQKGWALSFKQQSFRLAEALQQSRHFSFTPISHNKTDLRRRIEESLRGFQLLPSG